MIVDCFPFYNEIKMLLFRLEYLWDTVDFFLIVEATHTYANNPKPSFLNDNIAMFDKYRSKIIHVIVEFPTNLDNWGREKFQRDSIDRCIRMLSLVDSDTLIISDCDEIPNKDTLRNLTISDGVHALNQHLFYYNFSGRFDGIVWRHPKVLNFKTYIETGRSAENVRMTLPVVSSIENGGWHFSYFGTPELISNKIKNFSHQEYNYPEYTNIDKITKRMNDCQELFDRAYKLVDTDISLLPEKYEMLLNM